MHPPPLRRSSRYLRRFVPLKRLCAELFGHSPQIGYRVPRLVFTPAGRAVESFVGLNQDLQAQAKVCISSFAPRIQLFNVCNVCVCRWGLWIAFPI